MLTSSRLPNNCSAKKDKFSRLRSCPALTPKPIPLACIAAILYGSMAFEASSKYFKAYSSVYNSIRSAPTVLAPSISSRLVSMNILVRIPACLKAAMTSLSRPSFSIVFQPALDVRTPGGSGTSVTWSG